MNNYIKPTLNSAINSPAAGHYYEFNKNGNIIHRYPVFNHIIVNYWISNDECNPTPCTLCQSYNWSLDADFIKLECSKYYCNERFIPCHVCGRDCNGSDYQKLRVCSRGCL